MGGCHVGGDRQPVLYLVVCSSARDPAARLAGLLGLSRPVLLAPMAAISGGELAAAFSVAGGYGFLGGGYGVGTWIEDQWTEAQGADIGIGLITWTSTDDVLDRVLASPRSVWLSFGDPRPFAPRITDSGAVLVCQVGTEEEAGDTLKDGASVLVAQGTEAGGHGRFEMPTHELIERTLSRDPAALVVAAGGVVDSSDLQSAIDRGAGVHARDGRLRDTRGDRFGLPQAAHRRGNRRLVDGVHGVRPPAWSRVAGGIRRAVAAHPTDRPVGRTRARICRS